MSLQLKSTEKKPFFFEVTLSGRLDSSTYSQLENQLKLLMGGSAQAIALDMSLLEYISSMGLRVIFKGMKDMKARGGMLMLANMQPQIKKVFEIANALSDDSVFLSVEEADRYYQAIQDKVKNGEQGA
jgi:anti-anti-sigma factor